ncbi:MAG: hypothetical protein OEM24_14065, partial [Paracoccaceae bacterium]|nr:hypothetical protein [Paracoccaceae bacterium]
ANGMSEAELADFIRAELEVESEHSRPLVLPVRSANETKVGRIAFFVSDWSRGETVKRGIIDVSGARPRMVRVEDYDECRCSSLRAASSARLVAAEPEFVVARYIPRTGTCVAVEQTEVFRIGKDGSFERAWQGTTYEAYGADEAVVADIRLVDHLAQGDDRAILRTAKRVRCGDEDCFCRDGPLIRDFVELFLWDPAARQFRPAR